MTLPGIDFRVTAHAAAGHVKWPEPRRSPKGHLPPKGGYAASSPIRGIETAPLGATNGRIRELSLLLQQELGEHLQRLRLR